ncbi:membrane-associated HD superfamily phosphohydrolase [Bacillus sp. SORGH_AS 510]|uniref:CBO0543 family protein n=1 Tax=Bacillus sp. SORGH_AS_0510 TaxID=3041771 RepID=UPI002782E371|nr:CBO0543 family protein [Bacillus sp. SORGH_AS_0510]MDQ1144083.1 membrane-associated HD superfamily phosphohydrolase [Bacillus sp. SORGH_AS_0510]
MKIEILILVLSWIICGFLLVKYVTIERKREAHITFLFASTIAWIYEYLQVVLGLVEFPFREFEVATKMSFSLHYFVYPTFCVFFVLFYPLGKGNLRILVHFLLYSMAIATYTLFIEKYSTLVHYSKWNWFMSVLTNIILLYIIKKFVFWFKKGLV